MEILYSCAVTCSFGCLVLGILSGVWRWRRYYGSWVLFLGGRMVVEWVTVVLYRVSLCFKYFVGVILFYRFSNFRR